MLRSHYIPQFILRTFCEDDKIQYMNLASKTVEARNTRSVFSVKGYYPEQLEHDLNDKIEKIFAPVHKKIISASNKLTLSAEEMFLLKKFLLVSVLRFDAEDAFGKQLLEEIDESERIRLFGEFAENIGRVLNCKSREELAELRFYGAADTNMSIAAHAMDITGSYLILVSSKDCGRDFLIPDKGNAWYMGKLAYEKYEILQDLIFRYQSSYAAQALSSTTPHDYVVMPLSRNVAAISMSGFYKLLADNSKYSIDVGSIREVLGFGNGNVLRPARVSKNRNDVPIDYGFDIKPLCGRDVEFLNKLLLQNAESHIAFANKDKLGIEL